jgi:hypothetical protein
MQRGKNWILLKEMNANRFFWDSHWLDLVKPLISLYGTEWRDRGYGLRLCRTASGYYAYAALMPSAVYIHDNGACTKSPRSLTAPVSKTILHYLGPCYK